MTKLKLSSPHYLPRHRHVALTATQIMLQVMYALIPGIVVMVLVYGVGVVIQILLAVLTALLSEALVAWLRTRRLTTLDLASGCLTAMLLALSLPPTAPWFVIVCAVAFGLLLGKHVYGGMGMNIFNPAMVGFCAVYLSFAADINEWPLQAVALSDAIQLIFRPATLLADDTINDAITGATVLANAKANGLSPDIGWQLLCLNSAWLVGGIYLLWRKVADWRLAVMFLAVFMIATALWQPFADNSLSLYQSVFLGAPIFCACFIITDPTTAATGLRGRLLYAALAALLAVIIRHISAMPDSIAFSVLLANACAPLIDSLTRPQYYRG